MEDGIPQAQGGALWCRLEDHRTKTQRRCTRYAKIGRLNDGQPMLHVQSIFPNPFFQIHFAIFAKPFRQPFFWALGKLEPPFRVDRASAGQVRGGHATPLLLGAATRWARLGRRASEPGSHHVLSHVPFLSFPKWRWISGSAVGFVEFTWIYWFLWVVKV